MKTEKYVKIIFQKGSIIFRNVTSFNIDEVNQLLSVTFEDKTASVVDMVFLNCAMGKLINVKDNIHNVDNTIIVDITDELER